MKSKVLLYGATGYVGELIAKRAQAHKLDMILAGRNQQTVMAKANQFGLESRSFGLETPELIDRALEDVKVILNCAGPFSKTAPPLVDACLRTGAHYTDIAGEAPEFEALLSRDAEAKSAQIMLLPGIGFGVVPTDCLAVYLKHKLPTANRLILIYETQGGVSQGTAKTVLLNLHRTGVMRQENRLISARPAQKSLKTDFGSGPVTAVTNPWRADYVTGFFSTEIPNIEIYTVFPAPLPWLMRGSSWLGWLFDTPWFQAALKRLIATLPVGPSEAERAQGKTGVVGIVSDAAGQQAIAKLTGPEAYDFTALAAIALIQSILDGRIKPGFQTPASAYGADLTLKIQGVTRSDD